MYFAAAFVDLGVDGHCLLCTMCSVPCIPEAVICMFVDLESHFSLFYMPVKYSVNPCVFRSAACVDLSGRNSTHPL